MTKTGDAINEKTQKTAQRLINDAYQKRRAKCKMAMEKTFGKEWAGSYLKGIGTENHYHVYEVLDTNGVFLEDPKVPDLDVLVALGQENLKGLLSMCRGWYHSIRVEQNNLDVTRAGIAKDNRVMDKEQITEALYCTGVDNRWKDLFGAACELCPKHIDYLNAYSSTSPMAFTETGRVLIAKRAEKINPAGKPCFVFVDQPENEELVGKFLRNLRLEREKLEQRKKTVVQYVKRVLAAKRDGRLQIDLPVFPHFRNEEKYLQIGDLYLLYIYGKEKAGLPTGFMWVRVVEPVDQSPLSYVELDFTGRRSALTYENMEQEIQRLGFDQFYSTVLGGVGPCVMSHTRAELDHIDIKSPVVLKPWEVMALRQNPEYAKMWVHSCFIGPDRGWEEREKFLQMILGEAK